MPDKPKKTILLTGASGFIGSRFLELLDTEYNIKTVSFQHSKVNDVNLNGIDCIVHLAGKAHAMKETEEQVYFDINYELTKSLADKATLQGVRHFIFISSVKVYGEYIDNELNETSPCTPDDAYGQSKLMAEKYLQSIQNEAFKVAIVRPPMVYGPGAKGNIIKLMQLASTKYPLPFGNIQNLRSVVFIDNLVLLLRTIIEQKAFGIFIGGDQQPVSSSFLIKEIRKNLHKEPLLFPIPHFIRGLIKKRKPALYHRLFGSFIINTTYTNQQLAYEPPFTTAYGISKMVEWYNNKR